MSSINIALLTCLLRPSLEVDFCWKIDQESIPVGCILPTFVVQGRVVQTLPPTPPRQTPRKNMGQDRKWHHTPRKNMGPDKWRHTTSACGQKVGGGSALPSPTPWGRPQKEHGTRQEVTSYPRKNMGPDKWRHTTSPCGQKDRCKNITFPQRHWCKSKLWTNASREGRIDGVVLSKWLRYPAVLLHQPKQQ